MTSRAISDLEKIVNQVNLMLEVAKQLPTDDLPTGAYFWATDSNLHCHLPASPAIYRQVRQRLGRAFTFHHSWTDTKRGNRYIVLVHRETSVELVITLCHNVVGATCQIRQIGEVTTPVYEMVCT